MRTLPVLLALVAACDVAPTAAPEADPGLTDRTVLGRLNRLESLGAQVVDRLEAAEATIAAQQATIAAQQAQLEQVEQAVDEAQQAVEEAAQRLAAVEGFVDDWQGEAAFLTAEVDLLRSRSQDLDARLFGGPGRQGGHLTVLSDYQLQLAGHPPGTPVPDDAGELAKLLFTTDPKTGVSVANVDGAGILLFARLRKRPEVLYQAWDQELDDYLAEVMNNPLYKDRSLPKALAALRDADAKLDEALRLGDAAVAAKASGEVKELADILKGQYAPRITALEEAEAKQGGEVKELADILENEYGVKPAFGFSSPVAGVMDQLLGLADVEAKRREDGDARGWAGVYAVGNAVCVGYVDEAKTPPQWICDDPGI